MDELEDSEDEKSESSSGDPTDSSDDDYMEIDSDASSSDSDDYKSASPMDLDVNSDTSAYGSPPAPAVPLNFVQEDIPSYPDALPKESTARLRHKRMEALLQSVEGLPLTWAQRMKDFFYAKDRQVLFPACFDCFSSNHFTGKSGQEISCPGPS